MLRITHKINTDNEEIIGLSINDEYIDVIPLFKMTNPRKRHDGFMKSNKYRRDYLQGVNDKIGRDAIITTPKPRKCIYYHKLLVKILLYSLDLLDFEKPIAYALQCGETLPTLDGHQFAWATMRLPIYDNSGQSYSRDIRFIKREKDGYMNLTFGLRHYDGASKKTTATITKNKQTLFKRIYRASDETSVDEVEKMMAGLSPKCEKQELENNKGALHKMYVDTEFNSIETWTHPDVFFSALMDCSMGFHQMVTRFMVDKMFGASHVDHENSCIENFEYISETRRKEMLSELEDQLAATRAEKQQNLQNANAIKKNARILGMTTSELDAIKPRNTT